MHVVVAFVSIIFGVVLVAVVISIVVAFATIAIPITHPSDRARTNHLPIRLQALLLSDPASVCSVGRAFASADIKKVEERGQQFEQLIESQPRKPLHRKVCIVSMQQLLPLHQQLPTAADRKAPNQSMPSSSCMWVFDERNPRTFLGHEILQHH